MGDGIMQHPGSGAFRRGAPVRRLAPALFVALPLALAGAASPGADPLALLTAAGLAERIDRSRLEDGVAVVVVLPARGRDLAVFGMMRTAAGSARLVEWMRHPEQLYRGRYMPAVRRFSEPPCSEDVADLVLEEEDLRDLRDCRPGDCGVKLSADEIVGIRAAAERAGAAWRTAVQAAFRDIVLARARSYLAGGLADAPAYHDHETPVWPAQEFDEIAAGIGMQPLYGPHVLPHLQAFPDAGPPLESLLYWSRETLGAGKPIVSITHVTIFRTLHAGAAGVVIAARQVFATHYLTGSLSLTMLAEHADGSPAYLVYLRRSRTDAFEGTFGAWVRRLVERRIRSDAPAALDALRRRLEGAPPERGGS